MENCLGVIGNPRKESDITPVIQSSQSRVTQLLTKEIHKIEKKGNVFMAKTRSFDQLVLIGFCLQTIL